MATSEWPLLHSLPWATLYRRPLLIAAVGVAAIAVVAVVALYLWMSQTGPVEDVVLAKGHTEDFLPVETISNSIPRYWPNIFLLARLAPPRVATARVSWVASNADGLMPGSTIGESTQQLAPGDQRAAFRLDAPPGGFVPGDYRAEIFVNDKLTRTLDFNVMGEFPVTRILAQTEFSDGFNVAAGELGGRVEAFTSQRRDENLQASHLVDGRAFEPVDWNFAGCFRCGWASADAALPQELVFSFNLQREALIGAVILEIYPVEARYPAPDQFPKEVEVWVSTQGSADGFAWVTGTFLQKQSVEQLVTFSPVGAKYLKLRIVSNYGGQGVQIGRIRIIETRQEGTPSILLDRERNLLDPGLGGVLVRFSSQYRGDGNGSAGSLVAGKVQEGWFSSDRRLPQELVFAFRGDRQALVDRLILQQMPVPQGISEGARTAQENTWVQDFSLSASDHPVTGFREIGQFVLDRVPDDQVFSLGSVPARFVKLRILSNYGSSERTTLGKARIFESRAPGYDSVLFETRTPASASASIQSAVSPSATAGTMEREPNDTTESANPILLGQSIAGRIDPLGESDYFSLDLRDPPSDVLNLELKGTPYVGTSLTLLSADGRELKQFEPRGATTHRTEFSWFVEPGGHYMRLHEPPISLALIWDTSGSMVGSEGDLEEAVTAYIDQMRPSEQLIPIRFASDVRPLLTVFSGNPEQLKQTASGQFRPDGNTAFYDAVAKGIDLLGPVGGRRAIIAMTDGGDTSSRLNYPGFWRLIEESGVRIYTIGLGASLKSPWEATGSTGERTLGHIAMATNGRSFFANTSAELKGVYEEIAAELRTPPTYELLAGMAAGSGELTLRETGERITGVSVPAQMELVLDASGSMLELVEGRRKIDLAKNAMETIIQGLPDDLTVGLRVFGHRTRGGQPGDCQDSELLVPFARLNRAQLTARIRGINALGNTPLAYSLQQVERDLQSAPGEKLVVLVTDGEEQCGGRPADVAADLVSRGLRVRVQVIGFDIADQSTRQELARIASATGGSYFDAGESAPLENAIRQAMSTTYDILDAAGQKFAGGLLGGSPINVPPGVYSVVVRSSPSVTVPNVRIEAQHSTEIVLKKEGQETAVNVVGP